MERRGTRRKSLSLGEGDILNSTTYVPPTSSTDRFPNFNPDRCVSTPHKSTDSVMVCGQEPMRVSSPALLSAPQLLYPFNTFSNPLNSTIQLSYSEELLLLMTPELPCSQMLSSPNELSFFQGIVLFQGVSLFPDVIQFQ